MSNDAAYPIHIRGAKGADHHGCALDGSGDLSELVLNNDDSLFLYCERTSDHPCNFLSFPF